MRDYIISTDSTCDLPASYISEHNLTIQPLYYIVDDVVYGGDNKLTEKEFYDRMAAGSTTSTMATNPEHIRLSFENILKSGKDILHIGFSSGLSSSYNNAAAVARELLEDYPEAKITVIDSLCASLGQGLLVNSAVTMKASGSSLDETAEWVEANKLCLCHEFTVDDLNYLQRGGRIKKSVAVLGTLINVKPVLHMDNEGHLISMYNVRGRKKSLISLVDTMAKKVGSKKNDLVYICHSDCIDDVMFVESLIKERFGIENFLVNWISPTIGSHTGAGTISIFYYGDER